MMANPSEVTNCTKCDEIFTEKTKSVGCDLCSKWFHVNCTNISDSVYRALASAQKTNITLLWYCDDCQIAAFPLIREIAALKKENIKIVERLTTLENTSMTEEKTKEIIKQETSQLKQETKQLIQEKMEEASDRAVNEIRRLTEETCGETKRFCTSEVTRLTDSIRKDCIHEIANKTGAPSRLDIRSAVAGTLKDLEDADMRRHNMIVHRLPEKETEEDDQKEIKRLLVHIKDNIEGNILSMTRLGQKADGKIRSVLVKFSGLAPKDMIMKNLKKLKDSEWNVSIVHDYSKATRELHEELIKEAKDKDGVNASDFFYRVTGTPGQERVFKLRKRR